MSGHIKIDSVQDMHTLVNTMPTLDLQGIDLLNYARTWVCQKDGFETSSVCALRPFAGAMDTLQTAFEESFTTFSQHWNDLRHAVAQAIVDYEKQEHTTVETMNSILGIQEDLVLPSGKHIPQ